MKSEPIHFENEAGFRALFEYATIGIIVVDAGGQIIITNPNAEELFGYSNAELIGQPIEILIPAKLKDRHGEHRSEYGKDPRPRSMGVGRNLHGLRKDGSEFSVEISLGSYRVEGERLVVSFITDITERMSYTQRLEKAVEEKTHQLQAALTKEKELSDLKSRFISIASHEFRTPLSAIISSASLIDRYVEREQLEYQRKHTERIRGSARNLNTILTDFLSLEKLEEGMVMNQPLRFNLNSFISEFIQEFEGLLKSDQKLNYTLNSSSDEVILDPKLLHAVLVNLVSNAIKYSDDGKEINIDIDRTSKHLCITVRDQGIGIPLKDQENLFNRFFRASNVGHAHGTGLGLNIVRNYLQIMGGTISFTSIPYEGTTFYIEIPVEEADPHKPKSKRRF